VIRFSDMDNIKRLPVFQGLVDHPDLTIAHAKGSKILCKKTSAIQLLKFKKKFASATGVNVSVRTIRRNLHKIGLNSRIATPKPLPTDKQRKARLNWCTEHQNWLNRKWKTVIWSDESKFTIFKSDGPQRVWRMPGTRNNIENFVPTIKHGGGAGMEFRKRFKSVGNNGR